MNRVMPSTCANCGCNRRMTSVALIFLSSPERKTVPVGVVSELIRGDIYFWGQLMAGALLGSIPVALVYSFFVEYYVTGLTGSVKG